jgi:hypothetical protein
MRRIRQKNKAKKGAFDAFFCPKSAWFKRRNMQTKGGLMGRVGDEKMT